MVRVKGYPNYTISKKGVVRSVRYKRYLKPYNQRYDSVILRNKKGGKAFKVHRLVAEAYIPNPHNKPSVHHINHNKKDNSLENLMWVTHKENTQFASEAGRLKWRREKGNKLTEEQVFSIRKEAKDFIGTNQYQICISLGEKYNVDKATIRHILTRRTWKHLDVMF